MEPMEPMEQQPGILREAKDSLDEHSSIIPFCQEYSPHQGKEAPPKLLSLFDDNFVPGSIKRKKNAFYLDSNSKEITSEGIIYQRTPKTPKLNLGLYLGLPSLDSSPCRMTGPSMLNPQKFNGSTSNMQDQKIAMSVHNALQKISPDEIQNMDRSNSLAEIQQEINTEKIPAENQNLAHESTNSNLETQDTLMISSQFHHLSFDQDPQNNSQELKWKSKFWAWISLSSNIAEDEIGHGSKQNTQSLTKMNHYLPLSICSDDEKIIIEGSHHDFNLKIRLKEIMGSIWALNHQILKILGISSSHFQYSKAQRMVESSFTRLMSKCKRHHIHFQKGKNPDDPECGEINEELEMYQKVLETLHATPDMNAYNVYLQGVSKKPLVISKPQMMRNAVAFLIVKDYYKTYSPVKWEIVFKNENIFMAQVAKFDTNSDESNFMSSLLPWESPSPNEILYSTQNILNDKIFDFENHVKPIFMGEMKKFHISYKYECMNQDEKAWAWISSIQSKKMLKLEKLFQPISAAIISKIRSCLAAYAKNLEHKRKIEETTYEEISRLFSKIFDLLWILNGKVLEAFGAELNGEDYINEQKWVQQFYLFCIFDLNDKRENQGVWGNEYILKPLLDLTLSLLISKDGRLKRFEVGNCYSKDCGVTIYLEEDLKMANIVANLLGYYYKNENIEKWNFYIYADYGFFKFINIRRSRVFYQEPRKDKKAKKYQEFVTHPMIPWMNTLHADIRRVGKFGDGKINNFDNLVRVYVEKAPNS